MTIEPGAVFEQVDEGWMVLVVDVDMRDELMSHRPIATILVLWDRMHPHCEGSVETILLWTLEATCAQVQ